MSFHNPQNPQTPKGIIPYAIYSRHKNSRRQIQTQRQQTQHTISFLEREAKKSARQLENKQKSLINYYQLKESRFIESEKKAEMRRKKQSELQNMKKTNSRLRQMSARKRTLVKQSLLNSNKRSVESIKNSRVLSQQKLKEEKQLQNQLLVKRNSVFSKALALGANHAKEKSQLNKKFKSSETKNDLIYVQDRIKKRQSEKIDALKSKQKELINIVQKNRRVKKNYDQTLEQFRTVPFEHIYPSIKKESRSRVSTSRRSSFKSETIFL